jgi:hypothetical protein
MVYAPTFSKPSRTIDMRRLRHRQCPSHRSFVRRPPEFRVIHLHSPSISTLRPSSFRLHLHWASIFILRSFSFSDQFSWSIMFPAGYLWFRRNVFDPVSCIATHPGLIASNPAIVFTALQFHFDMGFKYWGHLIWWVSTSFANPLNSYFQACSVVVESTVI